jgi:hypothetical protein
MADLEYIQPGDRKIPSRTFNTMVDAARIFRERINDRAGNSLGVAGHDTSVLFVKNSSGGAVDRFAVLGIDNILIAQATNADTFASTPSVIGGTPATATHKAFVITREPISDGETGKATVAGITPVQIDVTDADHNYAVMADGDSAKLASAAVGPVEILWKAAGTGTVWALVRFGSSSGAGLQLVDLVQDGGVAGSDTTKCSFTYTVSLDGTTLDTAADVLFARPDLGEMEAATYGIALIEGATVTLICTDEVPVMATCDEVTGYSDQ